jgi:hypothetical protein
MPTTAKRHGSAQSFPAVVKDEQVSSNFMEIRPSHSTDSATSLQPGENDDITMVSVGSKSESSMTVSEPPRKRWQPAAYSGLSLRKVAPPVEDGHKRYQANASPLPAVGLKKVGPPPSSNDQLDGEKALDHPTVQSFQSSLYSVASLKRIPPPQEDKWKNKDKDQSNQSIDAISAHDDQLSKSYSSLHGSATMKNVEKQNEPDRAAGSTKERPAIYSSTSLRSIGPPKEDKWRDLKTNAHLSSTNADLAVVEVSSPTPIKSRQANTAIHHFVPQPQQSARTVSTKPSKVEQEMTLEQLQSSNKAETPRTSKSRPSLEDVLREKVGTPSSDGGGHPKKLLMLISTMSGRQDQKAAQERAVTILKGMQIESGSDLFEQLDGADPANRTRRNELFAISGLRAKYPQFFLVDGDKTEFLADFESFEYMHDSGSLHDSMNLDALVTLSAHSKAGVTTSAVTTTTTTTSIGQLRVECV